MPAASGINSLLDLFIRDPNVGGPRGFPQPSPQGTGAATGPANISPADRQDPMAYMASSYQPRDTGGFFSLNELYDRPQIASYGEGGNAPAYVPVSRSPGELVPEQYRAGSNLPSTNNWSLLPPPYNNPNFIMRNGQIIDRREAQASSTPSRGSIMGLEGSGGNAWIVPMAARQGYPFIRPESFGTAMGGWPGQISGWSELGGYVS